MNIEQYLKRINKIRKENKDRWYSETYTVNEKNIQIKFFNTYIQRMYVANIDLTPGETKKVSEFTTAIKFALEYEV